MDERNIIGEHLTEFDLLEVPSKDRIIDYYKSAGIDENLKDDCIEEIKIWLFDQPYVTEVYSDQIVESIFVRLRDVEKTKQKIANYYNLKFKYSDILMPSDPTDVAFQEHTRAMYAEYLPKLTPEGYRVHITRYLPVGNDKFNFVEVMKLINMKIRIYMEEGKVDFGVISLVDCEKLSSKHIFSVTPALRSVAAYVQQVIPFKIKGIIFVNVNSIVTVLINWLKLLLKAKIRNRIYVYSGGVENFMKHVPADILPKDIGGSQDYTLQELNARWQTKLEDYRDMFLEEIKIFDEKLGNKQTIEQNSSLKSSNNSPPNVSVRKNEITVTDG